MLADLAEEPMLNRIPLGRPGGIMADRHRQLVGIGQSFLERVPPAARAGAVAAAFVVDDAVVEIENIVRHIEEGLSPYDAAMKGSGEIGFTVMAITFSLIAVFIPLFLMSGYVGLLFREFAVTVSVALVLSLVISRTFSCRSW